MHEELKRAGATVQSFVGHACPFFFLKQGLYACMQDRSWRNATCFGREGYQQHTACTCTVHPAPALTSTLSMRVGFHLLQDIALLPLLSHGRIIFFISLHFNLSRSIDVARLVITSYIWFNEEKTTCVCSSIMSSSSSVNWQIKSEKINHFNLTPSTHSMYETKWSI